MHKSIEWRHALGGVPLEAFANEVNEAVTLTAQRVNQLLRARNAHVAIFIISEERHVVFFVKEHLTTLTLVKDIVWW